jgi:hypothetical protein
MRNLLDRSSDAQNLDGMLRLTGESACPRGNHRQPPADRKPPLAAPAAKAMLAINCAISAQGQGNAMNYSTDFKSIKGDVSPEEWQARLELAACYRLVDKYGMTDLIYNHIIARIPGSPDHLLINLYGLHYKEGMAG